MPPRLTPTQITTFRREGFLLFNQPLLAPARFAALQARFEDLLAEWIAKGVSRSPEHMDVPHFWDPSLFSWLLDEQVLDVVESLLGPDIALYSSHFLCKPPAIGKRVPWHEDSSYWKSRLDPMEVVTIWLAIDPSTPANGCMRVIPRSHHNGFSQYDNVADPHRQVFSTEIRAGQFDESTAVDCILAPNHCSLHDGKLIHGSNPNTGSARRCGYTMRYISAATRYLSRPDLPHFQTYLARGQDRAGCHTGDPTQINRAWITAHPDGQPAGH